VDELLRERFDKPLGFADGDIAMPFTRQMLEEIVSASMSGGSGQSRDGGQCIQSVVTAKSATRENPVGPYSLLLPSPCLVAPISPGTGTKTNSQRTH
jgi:hypothetical protein